ncbi:hypothetical protein ACS0TY_029087 [Phlomoides rotata]
MMDPEELADRKTVSVKVADSAYGEQIGGVNDTVKKFHTNYPEKPFAKTRELHHAKRDTNQLNESRKLAESARVEAKSELLAAKEKVKDLTLIIEETNARAERQVVDLEKLKMGKRTTEAELRTADFEREKVIRELESVKRELSKLKLDMASVMEEKKRAEMETRDSLSKRESYLSSVDSLNTKIEEIDEEHVLVELARIEAIKEYEEIEAQVREKAESYSTAIDGARKEKQTMIDEIEDAKELETKLAIKISDINMLQSDIKQVKEMDTGLERNEIVRYQVNEEGESGSASLLESVMKELEDTKKELALVKEESFQFMASMDVIRNELRHVAAQTARLKKKEQKSEMTIQNLNSKLLRAKVKLEETSAAEDKAKSIASNLSLTLEQVKSEAEAHEKERTVISKETATMKAEIERRETEIDLSEERLQTAIQDLKAAKSSEAIALENLKALIEKTIRNRASASRPSTTITISKFEYEYLKGNAAGAKEIAEKKVAAARAWVEALKASEKEIQLKSELLRRETREQRVEEEREVHQNEGSTNAKKIDENSFEKWRQMMEPEKLKPGYGLPTKAMNKSIKRTPMRRGKAWRSASPVVHGTPRSTSFTVRRRRKVMPNIAKFFSGKSIEKNP